MNLELIKEHVQYEIDIEQGILDQYKTNAVELDVKAYAKGRLHAYKKVMEMLNEIAI